MTDQVINSRKGDRFLVVEPIAGAFSGFDITLLNVSAIGAQIRHVQPLRIGTKAMLSFHYPGISATVMAHVVWSHLLQTDDGLVYRSGLKLHESDPQYAAAVNALLRAGAVVRDADSLERKRQRELERELRRQSSPKMTIIPPTN